MKRAVQLLKFICIVMLCGGLVLSCDKNDAPPDQPVDPPVNPGDSISINADTISNHLQFYNAIKKQGTIPDGPAGSLLKISFEDTLYLTDELKGPIKFLHADATKNVAGIYLQVHGAIGGTHATYYYDVPELPDMADSDTVSVIMIGIDPDGLIDSAGVPPAGAPVFDITIVPYDENGQPIAEADRPVKIEDSKTEPIGSGSCGLVLPQGDYWEWDFSYTLGDNNNSIEFFNAPGIVFGAGGQIIKGNCCNGVSVYGFCSAADTSLNASLHFATFYQITHESLVFFDNGTFFRQTFENSPLAAPAESDFCAGGEGIVHERINHTTYNGNWTTTPAHPSLAHLSIYDNPLSLSLQHTSSDPTGSGFGNPGGIIRQLNCRFGGARFLLLVQPDREGGGRDQYKGYSRRGSGVIWYPFE